MLVLFSTCTDHQNGLSTCGQIERWGQGGRGETELWKSQLNSVMSFQVESNGTLCTPRSKLRDNCSCQCWQSFKKIKWRVAERHHHLWATQAAEWETHFPGPRPLSEGSRPQSTLLTNPLCNQPIQKHRTLLVHPFKKLVQGFAILFQPVKETYLLHATSAHVVFLFDIHSRADSLASEANQECVWHSDTALSGIR